MLKKKFIPSFIFLVLMLALASLACGVSNLPFLATETPTPTLTFTPSPTNTSTPTPTSTATQTPSPTPLPTGAITEEQSDGSTLFVDYDNQFQFQIPKAWFVIPLSSNDIGDIIEKLSEENPEFKDTAEAFAKMDPDVIRVIAVNEDTKYLVNGFSTNLTVAAVDDKVMSAMPLDFVTGALEESFKGAGATVISNEILAAENANGVEIGVLEFQQTTPTVTGVKIQAHAKMLVFQSNNKLIMIQVTTPKQFAQEVLPVLDQILDTIKHVEG